MLRRKGPESYLPFICPDDSEMSMWSVRTGLYTVMIMQILVKLDSLEMFIGKERTLILIIKVGCSRFVAQR